MDCSSVSKGLQALTQALLQQLRADHEVAAALCRKVGLRSCKELRDAKKVDWCDTRLTDADLTTLGTLGSVLPALKQLWLCECAGVLDGMQRLAEGLGARALPAVIFLALNARDPMHVGDAGASALAAALGRGAMPRLEHLSLMNVSIGDAGLVALAPALRRLPALKTLHLGGNPCGDEGLAALVAPPPPPADALLPPTAGLTKLRALGLVYTYVTDAGCAILAAALDNGALPALMLAVVLWSNASAVARAVVQEALDKLESRRADLADLVRSLRRWRGCLPGRQS